MPESDDPKAEEASATDPVDAERWVRWAQSTVNEQQSRTGWAGSWRGSLLGSLARHNLCSPLISRLGRVDTVVVVAVQATAHVEARRRCTACGATLRLKDHQARRFIVERLVRLSRGGLINCRGDTLDRPPPNERLRQVVADRVQP